ncbi:MAG: hypothetical protein MUP17_03065, partial [candidate division Zixibacteria bacterium]|nr:hypothetical protein [candidate division Zixibacteria bacterium]
MPKKVKKVTRKEKPSKKIAKAPPEVKAEKYIYFFGGGKAEGGRELRDLLGGKGSGLAEMTNIGIPVPPGFTITTQMCNLFYKNDMKLPKELH